MELRAVDLNLLVALDALLQEESVTRAAQRIGLSTPAMSHALARLREQLDDPLLVRAGRKMVPSARGIELKARVRILVEELRVVMAPAKEFEARSLARYFRIHATDYILLVLDRAVDAMVRAEAPGVNLRYLPNTAEDAALLREGAIDLAIGVYSQLPPEIRTRKLFDERLVCVVRKGHPKVRGRLSLDRFIALEHIQVAPRGRPGGHVDDVLARRGLSRRVARAVPYFLTALMLVAETDYVLTVPSRAARATASRFGLRVVDAPLPLDGYSLSLIWHPRNDGDPGHRWLRSVFVRVAETVTDK